MLKRYYHSRLFQEEVFLKALRLQKEVTINGPDFWGRKAWIKFLPSETPGWFWKIDKKTEPLPITLDIVSYHKNRLALSAHGKQLHIYEHIGILRFLGVDGVVIESTPWPPYHGRALELWVALKGQCKESGEKIPWCTIKQPAGWQYPNIKQKRFTYVRPSHHPELNIHIVIEYPALGYRELSVQLPRDREIFLQSLEAYSQGWSLKRYAVSRLASLSGWPHHTKVTWPQEHSKEKTLELFALHRLVDALGAFSTVSGTQLLAGTIISERSGHEGDFKTLKALVPCEMKTVIKT